MKEAEKIINGIKYWSDKDQKNRTAVVILADKKESDVWGFSKGTTSKIAHLLHTLMIENKDLGHDIYVAACLYAHRHITAEERDAINAVMSAVVEERKKNRKEARNEIQDKTENLCVLHAQRPTADRAVKRHYLCGAGEKMVRLGDCQGIR